MSFEIETSAEWKALMRANNLTNKVRKEFARKGALKVKRAIIQDLNKGISPVKGKGKFPKYSPSYKKEIRKKNSKRMREANPTKAISPVNLRLTGGLHKSLRSFLQRNTLIIQFKNFLADIHNNQGAGKSKILRRLLPTKNGERFNRRIEGVLFDELKKAVDKVAKQFSGQ